MMTLAIHDQRLTKPGPQNAALRDYDSVRRAIAFISEHWRSQPTIEAIADSASVTPDELHHLFRRWAGLTPKAFMQALTLDHAKGLLRDSASVLDAALDSGLSGPGLLTSSLERIKRSSPPGMFSLHSSSDMSATHWGTTRSSSWPRCWQSLQPCPSLL